MNAAARKVALAGAATAFQGRYAMMSL